jgi:TRAP-type C4-dicarboxylate transport system substrate-binding protein
LAVKAAFEALGANTQTIAFQEVYLALANKTVDGQDNPVATTYAAKFYEAQKHLALTKHIYASIMLASNPRVWNDRLSADHRKVITEEGIKAGAAARKGVQDKEESYIAEMQKAGIAVTRPDVAPFRDKMGPAYDQLKQALGENTWNTWSKFVAAART